MKSKSDEYKEINEKLKLRPNTWPHQFTKDGPSIQQAEERWWQPMICVHCNKRYTSGRDAQPIENCPARNDRRDMARILNNR